MKWADAGSASDIDAAMNRYASEIVSEGAFETFEGRVPHAASSGLARHMDEFELVAEELRDLGNGVSFSVVIQPAGHGGMQAGFSIAIEPSYVGRLGRASGVEIEALAATDWTIRAGRVTSARLYQTKEQALKPRGWRSRR